MECRVIQRDETYTNNTLARRQEHDAINLTVDLEPSKWLRGCVKLLSTYNKIRQVVRQARPFKRLQVLEIRINPHTVWPILVPDSSNQFCDRIRMHSALEHQLPPVVFAEREQLSIHREFCVFSPETARQIFTMLSCLEVVAANSESGVCCVILLREVRGQAITVLPAAQGIFIQNARSASQAEVTALDIAADWLSSVECNMTKIEMQGH